VASGFTSIGTVGLAASAPVGGATVMLSSSDPSVATVPASVLVPAGRFSAQFAVNTNPASPSPSVNISATYNGVISVAALSVQPVNPSNTFSIWNSSATPTVTDDGGTAPVEVGVKLTADTSGFISGIRFYKSLPNTGTHFGSLWTGAGNLLATATFSAETASGWQQLNFGSPVAITANTVYIASYHTDTGHTADDHFYFSSIGADNLLLHAPASASVGGNGVFVDGTGGLFPQTTIQDSNYWVDVVFLQTSPPAQLFSLTLNPTTVRGGQNSTGTVTLTAPAPTGGAAISLTTDSPSLVDVPKAVTVPAGMTTESFSIGTSAVKFQETVTISASFGAVTKHAALSLSGCLLNDQHDSRNSFNTRPCFAEGHEDHQSDHGFEGRGHDDDDHGHKPDKSSHHDGDDDHHKSR
jgi:hypothetical protein